MNKGETIWNGSDANKGVVILNWNDTSSSEVSRSASDASPSGCMISGAQLSLLHHYIHAR